ncbi:hypothetical protein ACOME3_002660 [Neoechinorhynchus agilis]
MAPKRAKRGRPRKTQVKRTKNEEFDDFIASSPSDEKDGSEPERSDLVDECEELFKTRNLYIVLGLPSKDVSMAEIRRAYYKSALANHPDKVEESKKSEANQKFILINRVYNIIGNVSKRADYDRTGCINEDVSNLNCDYRSVFTARVTVDEIRDFERFYRFSQEEKNDVIRLYEQHKGDWDRISEFLLLYRIEDDDRYKEIAKANVEAYKEERPSKLQARQKKYKKEAKEADKQDMDGLIKRIQGRKQGYDDMIDQLEAKYVKKGDNPEAIMDAPPQERILRIRRPRKYIPFINVPKRSRRR